MVEAIQRMGGNRVTVKGDLSWITSTRRLDDIKKLIDLPLELEGPAARTDLFAYDGSDPLRAATPDLVVDEPLAPLVTAMHITDAKFGKVDKVYVHTSMDQVISPAMMENTSSRAVQENRYLSNQATTLISALKVMSAIAACARIGRSGR